MGRRNLRNTRPRDVTVNAERYLSRTANFTYKCVQSSSEIGVNDIGSVSDLSAGLSAPVTVKKKKSLCTVCQKTLQHLRT